MVKLNYLSRYVEWLVVQDQTETRWFATVNRLAGLWWNKERFINRLYCSLLAGHVVKSGDTVAVGGVLYNITPDYCDRCFYNYDEINDLEENPWVYEKLHSINVWMVEREWGWYKRLWHHLWDTYGHKMPEWMEY